jgi:putative Ca2+/H+ antiporter (TMEM165/GDT1 family)
MSAAEEVGWPSPFLSPESNFKIVRFLLHFLLWCCLRAHFRCSFASMTASTHQLLTLLASIALAHSLQSSATAWVGRRVVRCSSAQPRTISTGRTFLVLTTPPCLLRSSSQDDREEKLNELGFTPRELQSSSRRDVASKGEENVNVNLVESVDAVTLTAVGFGLIALNFFVFANLGDGGIGGVVASIINLSRQ